MGARWSLIEYGEPKGIIGAIAYQSGLDPPQVRDLVLRSGERVGGTLGYSANPISVIGDHVRAIGLAGQLRVAPGIEVEIAPKFLGSDQENPRWREDFFFLATLSRHGKLLALERLQSGTGERADLHTLVARSMIDMYWQNYRRPNRAYRLKAYDSFAYEGDIDPVDVVQPSPGGFRQSSMVFDSQNHHNSVIVSAARLILPNLRDPSVIAQLERMIHSLSPQEIVRQAPRKKRLQSRAKRWQPLYDLSVDVLRGFGVTYSSGSLQAPGYVLNTWRVWEDLLSITARMGFGPGRVLTQKSSRLGTRVRVNGGQDLSSMPASVSPDISILDDSQDVDFLIDAKYKGRFDQTLLRVSEADLYESLAFASASKCDTVVLAYPAIPKGSQDLGNVEVFEQIAVNRTCVIGVQVDVRGISSIGGLSTFAKKFSAGVMGAASRSSHVER